MNLWQRIVAVIGLPLALFTLVFSYSPVSKDKQIELEQKLDADIQKEFKPVFRFAVASDVHIHDSSEPRNAERFAKLFQTAYKYSDSHPTYKTLDAVLLAGDIVDNGADAEYAELNRVVKENKRDETEFITVMGNHEFHDGGHEGYKKNMKEDLDKHIVIKGFHIIGLSPSPKGTFHMPSQWFWLDRELKKASADDPDKPIFTMQHGHIWNTVYVSRSWSSEVSVFLHLIYSKYPQVINFSGHSHGPINNPISVWRNNYTLFGTGTLNYFEMEDDIGDDTVPDGCDNAAQYYIFEVDAENHVRALPFNILTEDFMKTPSTTDDPDKQLVYYIDKPSDVSSYVYTSARKKTDSEPRFDKNAGIRVGDFKDGSAEITFDRADGDVCVYGYRITVNEKDSQKKIFEKEIYAEYYFEPIPSTQHCTADGLKSGTEYTVSITPMNVWKAEGKPLTGEFKTP